MRVYLGKIGPGMENVGNTVVRRLSHGYKRIVIGNDLAVSNAINFKTQDSDLVLSRNEPGDTSREYSFFCKEFGLYGFDKGVTAKVSIIFCDDGIMFVTLISGRIVVEINGNFVCPVAGEYADVEPEKDKILWVDAGRMLSMKSNFGTTYNDMYYQDFEFVFQLEGGKKADSFSMKTKFLKKEYVDLSLGYIAELDRKRENARREKEAMENTMAMASVYDGYDMPDYDDEYEEGDE